MNADPRACRFKQPTRREACVSALGLSAIAALAPINAFATELASPIADTTHGRVRGALHTSINVFRGIPYGGDTAKRRFMPPVPPARWTGIRDALDYGKSCPQTDSNEPASEDCLVLNVWTRALRDGAKRAVMVYFHGGEFSHGSGSAPLYDGVNLCRRGDVVVVTVNHRLSALGHLFLAKLGRDEFAQSGNAGLLDLVLALNWIKDNIEAFGGDPSRVMVFGQSGGGAKIATLMAMPAAKGLFHRAATMSGQQPTASGPNSATARARAYLAALGLTPERIGELKTLPVEKLIEAETINDPLLPSGSIYFGPVLDGSALPRHPFYPDAPAQSAAIPLILGNTHDETRLLIGGGDPSTFDLKWDEVAQRLAKQLQGRVDIDADFVVSQYRKLYPSYSPSDVFFAATTAGRSWRGQIIEAEQRARAGTPAYTYEVDWPSPIEGGKYRASHTIDIALVFDNVAKPGSLTGTSAEAQRMADLMSDAFIAFAKTGNPQTVALPAWRSYELDRRSTMIFDLPPKLADDPRGAERRIFEGVPFTQKGT